MGPVIPNIALTNLSGLKFTLINNQVKNEYPNNVFGTTGQAMTNRGRLVKVWIPRLENSRNTKYFCHGLSLDTYRRYGYSVFSGEHILKCLEDEFFEISLGRIGDNAITPLFVGDVVSFSDYNNKIQHTSLVVNVPPNASRRINNPLYNGLMVWSKPGMDPERVESLLDNYDDFSALKMHRYWRPR
ncbi:MAG: hypothetical protein KAH18_09685 [Psychromonas sp.]|nr:hypothetical protein [Psychromonas sp.]